MSADQLMKELRSLADWISCRAQQSLDHLLKDWNDTCTRKDGGSVLSSNGQGLQKFIFAERLNKLIPTIGINNGAGIPFNAISLARDENHLLFLLTNLVVSPIDTPLIVLSAFDLELCNKAFRAVYEHLYDTFGRFEMRSTGNMYYKENLDFILVLGTVHIVTDLTSGSALKANSAVIDYCAPSYYDKAIRDQYLDLSKRILRSLCSNMMHKHSD